MRYCKNCKNLMPEKHFKEQTDHEAVFLNSRDEVRGSILQSQREQIEAQQKKIERMTKRLKRMGAKRV